MVKTSLKFRKDRGSYFYDQITKADTTRGTLFEKREKLRDMYYREPGGYDATEPWEGAADIHLPVIMEKVETGAPKIMSALWRADPFVNVSSPGGVDMDRKAIKNVERFISWAFRNDIPDFYVTLENFIRNMLIDGTAVAKIIWEREWRRAVEVHRVKAWHKQGSVSSIGEEFAVDTPKTPDEILFEIFGLGDPNNTVYKSALKGKDEYVVDFTEEGRKLKARVKFEKGDKLDEVNVKVFRKVIDRDSPKIDLVELEDIVLPFRSKNIHSADWVAHKTWYTHKEIKDRVSAGEWQLSKAHLHTLSGLARNADGENKSGSQRDVVLGVTGNTGSELKTKDGKVDPNRILVWEVYTRDFVDGEDEPIDVVYFIPDQIKVIAGVEYHDNIFPHGERPFVSSCYIPVPDRFYGIGMAEVLYAINLEVDNLISNTHNNMAIVTNPVFLYSPFGMANNDQLLDGIKPGQGIPTADPGGVVFPKFSQEPLSMFHASMQTMMGYADRLTFSPAVGGSSNYRNAPRTARGTVALMNAAEEHLSSIVEQLQATAWKDMVSQVVSLYGRFVGIDKWYSVTGEAELRRISPKDLRNNFLYQFTGSLTSVNRDSQRALAQQRYMNTQSDQLYASDPHASQARLRDFMNHMTEGQDVEVLIPALPGEGGFSHPPMRQEDELRAMRLNVTVDVLPTDNHQEHLAKIESFVQSAAFEELPQHTVALIAAHQNQHTQMLQQQQMIQQKVAGMGGNGNQAPAPGAPVEGNPAEGGELSGLEGGNV